MFSAFYYGVQQDFKIFLLAPFVCAIFRAIFLYVHHPTLDLKKDARKVFEAFRYAFWWGMDFNAYVFLFSLVLVSVPGAFLPSYAASGDDVRACLATAYVLALYAAFCGKMIWFSHYHDIYNRFLWLGKNADKKNLLDIFFRQDKGLFILLGFLPIGYGSHMASKALLALPSLALPSLTGTSETAFGVAYFLGSIAFFYFFRFGGTFRHRLKPEWDEVPLIVKEDVILAKATVDDLVALEIVIKHPPTGYLSHSDEETKEALKKIVSAGALKAFDESGNPLDAFRRTAKGARIKKPRHIFLLVGESYSEVAFDEVCAPLNLAPEAAKLRAEETTYSLKNFIPAGEISQPSLVAILSGIYDAELELNEQKAFWQATTKTSLPVLMKKLGYRTEFWYGGTLNWGSLVHYIPGIGFDAAHGGTDICPSAPKTWLGVYDGIFLTEAARRIKEAGDEPSVHVLYTTSNHGPYLIPTEEYGFDFAKVDERVREKAKSDAMIKKKIGCFWYAAKAIDDFIAEMKEAYPDSLFIVTGDHAMGDFPFDCGLFPQGERSMRERTCATFFMNHRELKREFFAGNTFGTHLNILPTIIELIAPKGYEYYSLLTSLTEKQSLVVSGLRWLDEKEIGSFAEKRSEALEDKGASTHQSGVREDATILQNALLEITGYLIRNEEYLDKTK